MHPTYPRQRAVCHTVRGAFGTVLLAGLPLLAQPTDAPTADASDDDTIILNPFVIEADSETGWVATQSLAGSRINTDLKDIAAPIEVLTKDFMDEFGLTSVADATIYTTNVEGVGDNLETGPGLGFSSGFPPPTRIRGLGNGTQSRDFFAAQMGTDNYNLDRVTIASGPNNLLFGTGNPAGVIDSSLKRAMFRNFRKLDTQFDSNGSQRYAFDLNQVLIPRKLAVRLDGVHEEKEFPYKPNGYDHDRLYATMQFRPWQKTSISVHYEDVSVKNVRPSLLVPFDKVTPWYQSAALYPGTSNMPTYANPADGAAFDANSIVNTVFEGEGKSPLLFVGPNSGGLSGQTFNLSNTVRVKSPKDVPGVNGLNNEADGYTLLNDDYVPLDNNVGGLSKLEKIDSQLANLFISQQVGENLFLEFATQQENYLSWNTGMFSYVDAFTIKLDPNRFMADGVTPNPNVGKMYVDSQANGPFRTKSTTRTTDWRFSASYEFDFEKGGDSWWRQLMGKQRLAGLVSGNTYESKQGEYFLRLLPQGGIGGTDPVINGLTLAPTTQNGWANDATRSLQFRYYLDPAQGDYFPQPDWDLFKPYVFTDATGRQFTIDMENTGLTDSEGRRLGAGRTNTLIKSRLETQQIAYQGFFWDDRVVATLGWRRDTANAADIAANGAAADAQTGLHPVIEDIRFDPYDQANEQSGTTTTRGFIARPLSGLVKLPFGADITLSYNKSDTFQPDVSNRDPYGNRVPGATGAGTDQGIRLSVFDGKFALRYTDFENSAGPSRAGNVPYNRFRFSAAGPINRLQDLAFGQHNLPTDPDFPGSWPALGNGDPYWVTSYQKATGSEWGLDWNVTNSLTVRFNMNSQEVVESRIGEDWWAFIDTYLPYYQSLTFPEGGVNTPKDLNKNGVIDTWTWDTAWRTNSNQQTIADWWQQSAIDSSTGKTIIQSLDGKANEFVRDNRYNLNWVYRFNEGRLKGLSVGGAFRHRAAPLLSYAKTVINGSDQLDLSQPLYGKEENLFDLSLNYRGKTDVFGINSYRVGLNIRNLLDADEYYSKLKNVAGETIRLGRPSEGRTYILSLSLEM